MTSKNRHIALFLLITSMLVFPLLIHDSSEWNFLRTKNEVGSETESMSKGERESELPDPVSLLFVGDIMLDRAVALHAQKYSTNSLLSKISNTLKKSDAVIGNLEGTITNKASIAQKDFSILRFTFDPKFSTWLSENGFRVLSLANNHALDFGEDGYAQTTQNLVNAGIKYFGSPRNNLNLHTSLFLKQKEICFVGYHDLYTRDANEVIDTIKNNTRACSYTVLFAHWGKEYETTPNERQVMLAHFFIDAGADLVVGAHPHVVQSLEIYKNKAIFYSLGNFIFDQNISFETEHGMMVEVTLLPSETHFSLIPIFINKSEVEIASRADYGKILKPLFGDTLSAQIISDITNEQKFVLPINYP